MKEYSILQKNNKKCLRLVMFSFREYIDGWMHVVDSNEFGGFC